VSPDGGPAARERAFPCLDGARALAATAVVGTHVSFWTGADSSTLLGRAFTRLDVGVPIFWLPQGVGVVLLPRLADEADRRRLLPAALALVAGVGALLTLATAALGPYALPLVGGSAYGDTLGGATWWFAALGTALALAQLLLYSGIAVSDRLAVGAVWAAALVEGAVVQLLSVTGRLSATTLAVTAVGTALVLVGVGLLRPARERVPPPDA
jgi:hypothetical protein